LDAQIKGKLAVTSKEEKIAFVKVRHPVIELLLAAVFFFLLSIWILTGHSDGQGCLESTEQT
jgi:hypothetical protein